MPRSRFDELVALAEDNDGLVTAEQARAEGFTDSVLARLVQRRRIVRIARGVYRVPYLSPGRFSQYREAVLWAKANRGPDPILPVTTIERTITDLLQSGGRTDLLKQAIFDARREGYISGADAAKLRRRIERHLKSLRSSPKTLEPKTA